MNDKPKVSNEVYLGDGAYIHIEPNYFGVEIYTSNGQEKTNQVFLGPDETDKLMRFLNAYYEQWVT
jgi:hypothetical protein